MFWEFLKEFGFSSYELKALQGLLRLGKATPSEISEAENIPSSKIYSALDRLETAGLIVKLTEDNAYQLADQYQIAAILKDLQIQRSQEFNDNLGNLTKYLSHQTQVVSKSVYSLIQGREQIAQKLIFPCLLAPHDFSIYWNVFNAGDLRLLIELLEQWKESKREYTDRILIYSTSEINLDLPTTRKLAVRKIESYKGNNVVLWGQKRVGIVLSSTKSNMQAGVEIIDSNLAQSYLSEFEEWWFSGQILGQN